MLYFWCCFPFICTASFIFDSSTKAFTTLICWNIIATTLTFISINLLKLYISNTVEDYIHKIASILLPSYALGNGVIRVATYCTINELNQPNVLEALSFSLIICMLVSGGIFWTILYILQSKTIAIIWHKFSCRLRTGAYQVVIFCSIILSIFKLFKYLINFINKIFVIL